MKSRPSHSRQGANRSDAGRSMSMVLKPGRKGRMFGISRAHAISKGAGRPPRHPHAANDGRSLVASYAQEDRPPRFSAEEPPGDGACPPAEDGPESESPRRPFHAVGYVRWQLCARNVEPRRHWLVEVIASSMRPPPRALYSATALPNASRRRSSSVCRAAYSCR